MATNLANWDYKETSAHVPVMLREVLSGLKLDESSPERASNLLFIDATLGGGGHTLAIAEKLPAKSYLLALDRDPEAIKATKPTLKPWIERGVISIVSGTLTDANADWVGRLGGKVDGILLDLGLSSDQLNDPNRGFAANENGPLDMRLNRSQNSPTAADLLAQTKEVELARIFYEYGDEPQSRKLARAIVARRERSAIVKTSDLLALILKTLNPRTPMQKNQWLARNFMALRIAVNFELKLLQDELAVAIQLLKPGGRLVVLSYHSGEDRVVKRFIRIEARDCICPANIPQCQCGHTAKLKSITKKPLRPSISEVQNNSRSRSALLRIAERQ